MCFHPVLEVTVLLYFLDLLMTGFTKCQGASNVLEILFFTSPDRYFQQASDHASSLIMASAVCWKQDVKENPTETDELYLGSIAIITLTTAV